jgi:UDP-N-acetylglucosamine--N-acetylmuramyl-(pentapeptide) pyrophosphoryl-undecaprenol N-acetylglucosamine transferase
MFPAQALAEEAKARGWDVLLLTDARGERYAKAFPADEIVLLPAGSPNAAGIVRKLRAGVSLLHGVSKARKALRSFEADMVMGFGGYPSAPGMFAAQRRHIPNALHEQNAVLGRANRFAAGRAHFIAHAFPLLEKLPAGCDVVFETGNPVRQAVEEAAKRSFAAPAAGEPLRVLVFGGSQGARLFADVFPKALARLPDEVRSRLAVVHQVPDEAAGSARNIYAAAGIEAEIAPFFDDLPSRMAQSHLVVARSGASTVAEISTVGRASVLVPLRIAMDDHQRLNAEVLREVGAAEVILEDDLSVDGALTILAGLLSEPQKLTAMAEGAKGRMKGNAAKRLADLALATVKGDLGVAANERAED